MKYKKYIVLILLVLFLSDLIPFSIFNNSNSTTNETHAAEYTSPITTLDFSKSSDIDYFDIYAYHGHTGNKVEYGYDVSIQSGELIVKSTSTDIFPVLDLNLKFIQKLQFNFRSEHINSGNDTWASHFRLHFDDGTFIAVHPNLGGTALKEIYHIDQMGSAFFRIVDGTTVHQLGKNENNRWINFNVEIKDGNLIITDSIGHNFTKPIGNKKFTKVSYYMTNQWYSRDIQGRLDDIVLTRGFLVKSITLAGQNTVEKDKVINLNATVLPNDAAMKDLLWTSSDNTIATVDGRGLVGIVRGLRKGTVTITARSKDGSNISASKTITVNNSPIETKGGYYLIGEEVEYLTGYSDLENDPKYLEEFKYTHDSNYLEPGIKLDNSLGKITYNDTWMQNSIPTFSKPGAYKVSYRVKDSPSTTNKPGFENYRYYSKEVTATIYIHRRPIALFSVTNNKVTDNSYDLDHQTSMSNKGIIKWEWTYINDTGIVKTSTVTDKVTGQNTVNKWITDYPGIGYQIFLKVQDIELAWSDIASNDKTYSKPIANFDISKPTVFINIETQTVTDYSYDPAGLALTYNWGIFKGDVNVGSHIGKDVNAKINSIIKDKGIGTYKIELYVVNSANLKSDIVSRNFEVVQSDIDMRAKLKTELTKFSLSGVPASENLIAYDLWTKYQFDVKLQLAMYSGATKISSIPDIFYSANTGTKTGQEITWKDVLYNIPATTKNGDYIMNIRGLYVDRPTIFREFLFNVKVKTPIDLQPVMPSSIKAEELVEIKANTSKYVNNEYNIAENTTFPNNKKSGVTVILFYGTPYATAVELMGKANPHVVSDKANWTISKTFAKTIPSGTYKARFIATLPSGEYEEKIVNYNFIANTPPEITDGEVYTRLGGSFIYENDDINFRLYYHDADLNPVSVDIKLYDPEGKLLNSISKIEVPIGDKYPVFDTKDHSGIIDESGNRFLLMNIPKFDKREYKIVATITDDNNESVTKELLFAAYDLWVKGAVNHVDKWNENRSLYNAKYPEKARSDDTFWSGEAFITSANTTEINSESKVICTKVSVEIINPNKPSDKKYLDWLEAENPKQEEWYLQYFHKDWNNKWGNYKPQKLIIRFTSYFNNGWIEIDEVEINIDNRDPFWKLHRAW